MIEILLFKNTLREWYELNSKRILNSATSTTDRTILLTERAEYARVFHAAMEVLSNEHVHK